MDLTDVKAAVVHHIEGIKMLLNPDVKVTVVIRTPAHPKRDIIVTDDESRHVIAALTRTQ